MRDRLTSHQMPQKIDAALTRIEDGTYGYCEDTGEPISIKRLEARPIATLSIEAQERHERLERLTATSEQMRLRPVLFSVSPSDPRGCPSSCPKMGHFPVCEVIALQRVFRAN
jgi:hypothetical protein